MYQYGSPFGSESIGIMFEIEGDIHELSDLKYHTSFDWQIPVWAKVINAISDLNFGIASIKHNEWLGIDWDYHQAIDTANPEAGFEVLYEAITFINQQNEKR